LLVFSLSPAQARGHWGLEFDLGWFVAPTIGPAGSALPAAALSLQFGAGHSWRHGGLWFQPLALGWVMAEPPLVSADAGQIVAEPDVELAGPSSLSPPDPVIYPRHGQDARQTEIDRRDCNRWATTQAAALADAAVFQRTVQACMDGRGYTLK
jgi:hypothetical protein